jgi:hypothetical protein
MSPKSETRPLAAGSLNWSRLAADTSENNKWAPSRHAGDSAVCGELWWQHGTLPHLILIGEQLAMVAIIILEGRQ